MMEAVEDQSLNYTAYTPLINPEGQPRKTYCSSIFNGFSSIVLAPERGLEWAVTKISDIGAARGFGVREAKLALVVTSLGIIGECALQVTRLSINLDVVGMLSFIPGRYWCVMEALISTSMCLPLNGRLSVCCSPDSILDSLIRKNSKRMLRIAQAMTLFTCCFQIPLLSRMLLSATQVSYLATAGLINIPTLLLAAGMSKLIQNQYPVETTNLAPNVIHRV